MKDNNKKEKRWKKAQDSECKFYAEIARGEKFAKDYKYASHALDYKFERWGFKDFDRKSILEVGCNVFGPLHYVQGEETLKVGIDPLLGKLYKEVAAKDIFYIRGVGEKLPFPEGAFDVVLCHNVLDHVKNPEEVLFEIHRVLKNQGAFLLCVNTHPLIIRILNPIVSRLDTEHPWHFSPNHISSMVESQRFSITKSIVIKGFDIMESKIGLLKRLLKARKFKPFFSFFFLRTMYLTAIKSA